ncbi:hypothetical protein KL86DPRO_11039 [uncultured delta proteobacterium]|uniref:Polymer-forming cytoskeletal protein n=1 Tax=uncultured delta proteobacterium TaxID=34034 RepID=A0A212JAZ9_9DELT|nr:hypothetical protein KL86DPRO_11039 [uncultured delta proteobacterium]
MLYLLVLIALLVVAAPFVPGWIELRRGKDSRPLRIDMEYSKTPFFFGDQFDALLRRSLLPADGAAALEQREYTVQLSRPEKVTVVTAPDWSTEPGARTRNVVYAAGNLTVGEKARFAKELAVEGMAVIGAHSRLRALLSKGGVRLGDGVSVGRWVDARGGGLEAGAECDLGRNAASAGPLSLGPGCAFNNLYGSPIRTFAGKPAAHPVAEGNIRENALVVNAQLFSIPAGAELHNDVIAAQDLKICSGSVIFGDIKGLRNVELEDGVTVHGTVVADQAVAIGQNCRIVGNVFAQGDVTLGFGTQIGEAGHVKSVISHAAIRLGPGVIVYGYAACEKGRVAGEQEP